MKIILKFVSICGILCIAGLLMIGVSLCLLIGNKKCAESFSDAIEELTIF